MVKVYAVSLIVGTVGLVIVILGGALAQAAGRTELDPGERLGPPGRMLVAGLVGFGMAGLSAELSPLDLSWQLSLLAAAVGAVLAGLWARYASGPARS